MIVKIDKSLGKDLKKINDKKLRSTLLDIIVEIKNVDHPNQIKNLKKLQGAKNFYRIRIGD